MNKNIIVSIIIPYYNSHQYLEETLNSINEEIAYEVIIVNDGSTDKESILLLDELKSEYKIINQKNGGTAAARNHGAREAKGKYLLFLDADDLLQKNFCTEMVRFLENNQDVSFCYPNEVLFGSRKGFWDVLEYDPDLVKYYQYFMVTTLMRKSFFDRMNGFDLKFDYLEDREFWVRAAIRGFKGKKIPVLHFYRHHKESKTVVVNKSHKMNHYEKQIHRKFKKNYRITDYLNRKIFFYSTYIKLFYLVPQRLKNYILRRNLNNLAQNKKGLIKEAFPEVVKRDLF